MVALQLSLIKLQSFLLGLLSGIAHITLARLLDAKDIGGVDTLDKNFLKRTATSLVVKAVNGKNLLTLDIGQGKGGLDIIKLLLELRLVKEHEDIGVIDDSLLDNRRRGDILYLLGDNTDHSPMLTGGLVEILDILGHDRSGNGLPRLFDDQALTAFLDTHLLGEDIHNDKDDDREQDGVILDLIDLEDDKLLIEQ